MQRIDVQGETRFFDGPEGLLLLIEEKMGLDTREAVEEQLTTFKCVGECDHTYRIQEHYQRIIRDALEDLQLATKPRSYDAFLMSGVIKRLEDAL